MKSLNSDGFPITQAHKKKYTVLGLRPTVLMYFYAPSSNPRKKVAPSQARFLLDSKIE